MKPDFARRSAEAELMDDLATEYEDFRACLVDLDRVNRLTLAYRPTLSWLAAIARRHPGRPLDILDAGSGHGDMLRAIARWARQKGVTVRLTGVDRNPWSARAARAATPPALAAAIEYLSGDIFEYRPASPPDLIISSLFTHHLANEELVRFIEWMEHSARLGWFVNDLRRHPLAYHGFRWAMLTGRWHRFVRHDGAISILRAFTEKDWRDLLLRAGLDNGAVGLQRWFPFRLCVSRLRPSE